MRIKVSAACDVGLLRKNNEDLVLMGDELLRDDSREAMYDLGRDDRLCLAIADGMGGIERGEEASELVLARLRAQVAAVPDDLSSEELAEVLNVFAGETHAALPSDSGSTLAALLFYRGGLVRFHAGDSRLWRFRNGRLQRLTRDHSLRETGGRPDAPSNIITNALGGGAPGFLEIADLGSDFRPGDLFLVSSDGLHDLVRPEDIEGILRAQDARRAPGDAVGALVAGAKDRGGKDNISVLAAVLE